MIVLEFFGHELICLCLIVDGEETKVDQIHAPVGCPRHDLGSKGRDPDPVPVQPTGTDGHVAQHQPPGTDPPHAPAPGLTSPG